MIKNVILTNYLTSRPDHHRGDVMWEKNFNKIKPLRDSILKCSTKEFPINFMVLHDDSSITEGYYKTIRNQYVQCWFNFKKFLEEHTEYENVFCTDATDVIMLNNPFKDFDSIFERYGNVLFCGSEHEIVDNLWLKTENRITKGESNLVDNLILTHKFDTFLNSGILGGTRERVLDFATKMTRLYEVVEETYGDMVLFNYLMYQEKFFTGPQVHTVFRCQWNNGFSWFMHK